MTEAKVVLIGPHLHYCHSSTMIWFRLETGRDQACQWSRRIPDYVQTLPDALTEVI